VQHRRHICAIVDACSTARLLAPAFAALGYSSVHIQTPRRLGPPQLSGHRADDFIDNIVHDGNFEKLSADLTGKYPGLKCVLPGLESGVTLADRLSEYFGLQSNGSGASLLRRDKYAMAQAVERQGLKIIPVLKSADFDEIRAWVCARGIETVVLKPKSSSGTFGFNICTGESELRETFARLHRSRDIFGDEVDEVLVQPLIVGQEYAVNCVSAQGHHFVTDIWRTDKSRRGQSKVYEKEVLEYVGSPHYDALAAYVSGVLDALAIRFGPSHTEVMVTASGEILLIETAARLMGSLDVSMVTEALGHNAVQLTAEAYAIPQRFLQRLEAEPLIQRKQACMVQMLSSTRGRLLRFDLERLTSLRSFHGVDFYQKPGDELVPTVDSYSSPGLIFLSHPSADVIDMDYHAIREWERNGELYLVDRSSALRLVG
jgi:L-amino acid ligase